MARGRTLAPRHARRRQGRPRLTPSPLPPGCRLHGRCIQATVRKFGQRIIQSFPLGTSNDALLEWQQTTTAGLDLRYGGAKPAIGGTFAADALRYLRSVSAMPDIKGRTAHIRIWVELFGEKRRHTIEPADIRAIRDEWLMRGPKLRMVKGRGWVSLPEPLSASAVNNRLRALENLWTVLDGRHAYNPVKEVPEPREPDAKPRALPYALIEALLDEMPDRGQGLNGERRREVSKTKARLRMIAYAGLTHIQIAALKPEHFRFDPPAIFRKRRSKGAGSSGGWVPVPADAVAAMQEFVAADAWGPFSRSSMWKSFRRACVSLAERTGEPVLAGITPYHLRHSFASAVVRQTGDLLVAQRLLQHGNAKTTEKYVKAEIDPWLEAAMAKVTGLRKSGVK